MELHPLDECSCMLRGLPTSFPRLLQPGIDLPARVPGPASRAWPRFACLAPRPPLAAADVFAPLFSTSQLCCAVPSAALVVVAPAAASAAPVAAASVVVVAAMAAVVSAATMAACAAPASVAAVTVAALMAVAATTVVGVVPTALPPPPATLLVALATRRWWMMIATPKGFIIESLLNLHCLKMCLDMISRQTINMFYLWAAINMARDNISSNYR
ncbi:uncharacterized protein LOC120322335 [Drosophila yakuba]|uniref:uncharacterized protein LOC120322335 n=1 Tax=Drosophila yakuba TaxID=7245 RepID=UPI001930765D|nr:uncharacterized protein LOC120322335 [Drosophila yakuba]